MVLEETLESPLNSKEIEPVNPKGNQPWIFIGRTDGEAETPILWPPDAKNWLIWKDPDTGKDWRRGEKGTTEDKMVGWHHLTQWTWVWINSGSWWWTGRPGVLQSMGTQSIRYDRVMEYTHTQVCVYKYIKPNHFALYLKLTNIFSQLWKVKVKSLSCVWLFAIPWTTARQASLFITNSQSLLKLMSIESVMPSNHFILCRPLLLPPAIFPSIRVFSSASVLHIRWPKCLEFQLQYQSFQWIFRTDFLSGGLVQSPCCSRDSQESSPTPQFKSFNS